MARRKIPEIEYHKVWVKVYRSGNRFSAQFPKATGGRHRVERETEKAAFDAAKALIDELRDPKKHAEAIDRQSAERILAEHKIPLTVAAQDYARRMGAIPRKSLVEVVAAAFLAKKKDDTGMKNSKDHKYRILRFVDQFGKQWMHEVTSVEINVYLDGIRGSNRTRRNHRDSLVTFFRYAQAYGSLSRHEKPAAELSIRPKAEEPERAILSPQDGQAILSTARRMKSPALPALVFIGFCGSRHEEICPLDPTDARLDWKHVLWKSKKVHTPKSVSKLKEDRDGPLLPNALEWLKPFRRAKGPIFVGPRLDLELAKVVKEAGVAYPHNSLRHSYITYRILVTGDPAGVADAAGNSISTIEKHYRKKGVEKPTARAWFKISPGAPKAKRKKAKLR
jgi:hypothetical protein